MVRRLSNFKIGLFVVFGTLLGVAAIVWISASDFFQKTTTFVTYFDESVQGLDVDSSVKYRGVEIGRVSKISVAPDNTMIEVLMKVHLAGALELEAVAQLKMVGITGIVFIELDRRDPEEPDLSPKVRFVPGYPLIPSKPSDIRRILSGVDDIFSKIKRIDTAGISNQILTSLASAENLLKDISEKTKDLDPKGISDQIKSTAKAGENLLAGKKVNNILIKLESTATTLDKAINRFDQMLPKSGLEGIFSEVRLTLSETRLLISGIKDEIQSLKLAETAGKTNRLVEDLEQRMGSVTKDMKTISENLRRASETLERLLTRLSETPSDLLFSKPPPPRQIK